MFAPGEMVMEVKGITKTRKGFLTRDTTWCKSGPLWDDIRAARQPDPYGTRELYVRCPQKRAEPV